MWPGEAAEEQRKARAMKLIANSKMTRADFDEEWFPIPAVPAEQNTEAVAGTPNYTVKDSGEKAEYASGMRRDTTKGKPKFHLMLPEGVPIEEQLLWRVAMHYMQGGVKYGDRNWEKSCNPEDLAHHTEALWRHFMKFVLDVQDGEDHAAAIVWNVNAVLLTRRNIKKGEGVTQDHNPDCPFHPTLADLKEQGWTQDDQGTWRQPANDPRINPDTGRPWAQHEALEYDAERRLGFPKFGTPEFDALTEKVAAEQAKNWPKSKETGCSRCNNGVGFDALCKNCTAVPAKPNDPNPEPSPSLVDLLFPDGPPKTEDSTPELRCPDNGTCHHACADVRGGACFRVLSCGPLSGVYPGNTWPESLRREHLDREAKTAWKGRPDGP